MIDTKPIAFLPPPRPFDRGWIRVTDIVVALFALLLFAPLMLLVAAAIRFGDGHAALFGHRRYGRNGRTFLCLKFRSMAVDADARLARVLRSDPRARAEWMRDHKLRADPRVTRIGRFIRKYSIDELPQLINVLRGDMSLVGPRPIVAAEVARYGKRFGSYCAMRPGITGVWQISGRNDISYRRRIAMDSMMARHMSTSLYVRVLIGTARSLIAGKGAY